MTDIIWLNNVPYSNLRMANKKLKDYHKKRSSKKSPEPRGGESKRSKRKNPIFVIQHHKSSTDHYDFRIEVDDVLKSWVIPKGPSTDSKQKRLAIPTEDHPIEYANFEGNIPEGEYGAGTVLIWDRGTYKNLKDNEKKESVESGIKKGHITIWLKGKKLKGGYALTKTGKSKDANWIMVKMNDKEADARRNPVSSQPKSVKSGKTMKQVAKQK